MFRKSIPMCLLLVVLMPASTMADELTQIIQTDLTALGYDTGNNEGEMSTETIVAISKFQAENNLEVTGEASPQLAGIIKSKLKSNSSPADGAPVVAATAGIQPDNAQESNAEALQAAQQQCLQNKIETAQAAQKKKRGFGSLMRAVTNTAVRFGGNNELSRQVRETSYDIYSVDATADDWNRAAEDLGLTQDELEDCRNPQT